MPQILDIIEIDRNLNTSIPKQIAGTVNRLVEEGALRPGDRLPTLAQLAARTDASLCTIRHAYDLLAKQGVVQKTAGRGTFVALQEPAPNGGTEDQAEPNAALRGVRVGILCGTFMLARESKFRAMVEEFERLVSRAGGNTRIATCGKGGPSASKWDELASCDALLYLHPHSAADRLLERLLSFGRPLAVINYYGTLKVNRLVEDWDWAMRQVVIHLSGQGHRQLAMLSLDTTGREGGFGWVDEREQAFLSECRKRGMAGGSTIHRVGVGVDQQATEAVLNAFMQEIGTCTAVVTVNSDLAVAFIKAAADSGVAIPEDVSLVAFDNSFDTQRHNVTTVVHPNRSEAIGAFESLTMQLRVGSGSIITQISNRPELLIRGSVRRITL